MPHNRDELRMNHFFLRLFFFSSQINIHASPCLASRRVLSCKFERTMPQARQHVLTSFRQRPSHCSVIMFSGIVLRHFKGRSSHGSGRRRLPDNTQHSQQTDMYGRGGIRTRSLSRRVAADLSLRPRRIYVHRFM